MKGIYLVSEMSCLYPGSGASQHIRTGFDQLSKHFDMEALFPEAAPKPSSNATAVSSDRQRNANVLDRSRLRGGLRDGKHFLGQLRYSTSIIREVQRKAPDFVYYRAAFLDPLPIFLRARGIPCIIEANGLQFEARRKYYRSPLECWNRHCEHRTYRLASHVFFVGSYGDYWKLPEQNWTNVENGVETEFLDRFQFPRPPRSGPLRIAFVGSLMQHHRPDVLVAAVSEFADSHKAELHLIGSKLQPVADALRGKLRVIEHGFLDRDALAAVLRDLDVGLVSGVPKYQSQMKLFDYGAARMAVVAPQTHHLQGWHGDLLSFFPPGDASGMAATLSQLAGDRERVALLGNRLHERIRERFTWDRIFAHKANVISSLIARPDS
ncbi:glycosyltransferase [Rosistilla oblonga]|uniref:glycosyltransferase n=1 Tax=Rosistilla oblonga TaxID=2527990 RepID=UPI003A986B75